MTLYVALKTLHLLLLVFWLGTDLGVFYSGLMVQNQSCSPETRMALTKVMHFLDQFPRTCLILMVPVGLTLTRLSGAGFADVSLLVLWTIGLLAVLWAAASVAVTGFGWPGSFRTVFLRADRTFRAVLMLLAIPVVYYSLRGTGGLVERWLAYKIALYASIFLAGALIDFLPDPFAALFEICKSGSTPEREGALRRNLSYIYPLVVYIYLALIVIALISVGRLG